MKSLLTGSCRGHITLPGNMHLSAVRITLLRQLYTPYPRDLCAIDIYSSNSSMDRRACSERGSVCRPSVRPFVRCNGAQWQTISPFLARFPISLALTQMVVFLIYYSSRVRWWQRLFLTVCVKYVRVSLSSKTLQSCRVCKCRLVHYCNNISPASSNSYNSSGPLSVMLSGLR